MSGMRQLAGTKTRYRRAYAAPLAGLSFGRAAYKAGFSCRRRGSKCGTGRQEYDGQENELQVFCPQINADERRLLTERPADVYWV